MNDKASESPNGIVADVTKNISEIFRYLLPGVLIIGTARVARPSWFVARPSWFEGLNLSSWQDLAVLAVITLAVGNAWFVLNRFGLHQLIDCILYHREYEGPAKKVNARGYHDDLAVYVREALVETEGRKLARQHVQLRASSTFLIYTMAELALLAAIWSEPKTITHYHPYLLMTAFVVLSLVGLWQNVITRRIDAAVLHKGLVP